MPGDRGAVGEAGDLVDHHAGAGGVVGGLGEVVPQGRVERLAPPLPDRLEQLVQQRALALHQVEPVLGAHHVVGRDPLEHGDLLRRLGGYDQVGLVAHERPLAVRAAGWRGGRCRRRSRSGRW